MQWAYKIEIYFSLTEQPVFQMGKGLSSMLSFRNPNFFCFAFPPSLWWLLSALSRLD